MRLLVVATVALVVLPGCMSLFGHCGPMYGGAVWTEPGLYNRTAAWPVPPPPGLPVEDPPVAGASLEYVGWDPFGRDAYGPYLEFRATLGEVAASAGSDVQPQELAAWAKQFLANVTAASAAQREEWTAALLASKQHVGAGSRPDGNGAYVDYEVFGYQVGLDGPWSLDALVAGSVAGRQDLVTRMTSAKGDWSFIFRLPTHQVVGPEANVVVNPFDRAEARFDARVETDTHGDRQALQIARDRLNATLEQAGIARHAMTDFRWTIVVC